MIIPSKRLSSSIWFIDGTLKGIIILGQSKPESNGYEVGTPHSPKLQDCNLTIRCSLMLIKKSILIIMKLLEFDHNAR